MSNLGQVARILLPLSQPSNLLPGRWSLGGDHLDKPQDLLLLAPRLYCCGCSLTASGTWLTGRKRRVGEKLPAGNAAGKNGCKPPKAHEKIGSSQQPASEYVVVENNSLDAVIQDGKRAAQGCLYISSSHWSAGCKWSRGFTRGLSNHISKGYIFTRWAVASDLCGITQWFFPAQSVKRCPLSVDVSPEFSL